MDKQKITVHVPREMAREISRIAKELGSTQTGLSSLLIGLGLRTITDVDKNQIWKDEIQNGYTQDRKSDNLQRG